MGTPLIGNAASSDYDALQARLRRVSPIQAV